MKFWRSTSFRTTPQSHGLTPVRRFAPGLAAGVVWLVVGVSAGYWLLNWLGRGAVVELPAQAPARIDINSAHVALALGGVAAGADASAPIAVGNPAWQLLGVVGTSDGQGAALLVNNNQRPRPVRVGQAVGDSGLVLQAIEGRTVRLGPQFSGPSTVQLSLPEPSAAAAAGPVGLP